MMLERTPEGLEARIRPKGIARFVAAGFLVLWLCGWAAGEAFAGFAVLQGGGVAKFLLAWLFFWTLGGLFALRELLRLLWAEDRILVVPEGLRIERRLGPFRSTTTIDRSGLKRIYTRQRRSRLVAKTRRGTVEITALANRGECEALERELREALDFAGAESTEPMREGPPEGWMEVVDADGWPAIVQDPAIRATQARIASAAALVLAIPTILLGSRILDRPQWGALAAMLAVATVSSAWGAWHLSTTSLDWRPDSGALRLTRRSGSGATDLFEGKSLELVERSGSRGDSWFTLDAVAADGTTRRKIAAALCDPSVPRSLGAWISARAAVPFDDRATASRKAQDLAATIAQLEASGRLGQWMARMLEGLRANQR